MNLGVESNHFVVRFLFTYDVRYDMSSDPPTDPGTRPAVSSLLGAGESIEVEDRNQEVSKGIFLPDVVPIVAAGHTGAVGLFVNAWWIKLNLIIRGILGTGVQYVDFFLQFGEKHKQIAVVFLALLSVTVEEKWSDEPIITNSIKYGMEYLDPTAAEKIFAKAPAKDPIGDAARKAVEDATAKFLSSPDHAELQLEIDEGTEFKLRRQYYLAAGMLTEAHDVELEAAQRTAERRAEKAKRKAEEQDVAVPADVPVLEEQVPAEVPVQVVDAPPVEDVQQR